MKKVKLIARRTQFYFMARPVLLVALVVLVCLSILSTVEVVRANKYTNTVEEYKNSVDVLSVIDKVEGINKLATQEDFSNLCDLTIDNSSSSESYSLNSHSSKASSQELEALAKQLELISPPPAFNSFALMIPNVEDAREQSLKLKESAEGMVKLTSADNRIFYCTGVAEILDDVYFVSILQRPQGFSGLAVGQQEDFQSVAKKARSKLSLMTPPDVLMDEHRQIDLFFAGLLLSLSSDTQNADDFSRSIEDSVLELEAALNSITSKTTDIQKLPGELSLYVQALK